jgi:hypothetical protein
MVGSCAYLGYVCFNKLYEKFFSTHFNSKRSFLAQRLTEAQKRADAAYTIAQRLIIDRRFVAECYTESRNIERHFNFESYELERRYKAICYELERLDLAPSAVIHFELERIESVKRQLAYQHFELERLDLAYQHFELERLDLAYQRLETVRFELEHIAACY